MQMIFHFPPPKTSSSVIFQHLLQLVHHFLPKGSRRDDLNLFALAQKPHHHSFSVHLSLDEPFSRGMRHNTRRRQPVKNRLYIYASVIKSDLHQFSRVHKLHAFAKFALFKPAIIANRKLLSHFHHIQDAVQPDNRNFSHTFHFSCAPQCTR